MVYQGSHGGGLSSFSNLIVPTTTYVERLSFYKNLLGSVQKSYLVIQHNASIKTDKELFRFFISNSYKFFLSKLFMFSFTNGLQFNLQFLLTSELLLNSTFFFMSRPYIFRLLTLGANSLNSKLQSCCLRSHYYLILYSNYVASNMIRKVSSLHRIIPSDKSLLLFNQFPLLFDFSSSLVVNYYGDTSSILIRVSRTMNLCSNLYVKKNFSFPTTYF